MKPARDVEEMAFTEDQVEGYLRELDSGYGDDCPSGAAYGPYVNGDFEWTIEVNQANTDRIIKQAFRAEREPLRIGKYAVYEQHIEDVFHDPLDEVSPWAILRESYKWFEKETKRNDPKRNGIRS